MLVELWQDFLKLVKDEVGSRAVETWLKTVSLERWDIDTRTMYVKAPNVFARDWIQSKYKDLFVLHLGRLLNVSPVSIIFLHHIENSENKSLEKITSIVPATKSFVTAAPQINHQLLVKKTLQESYIGLNPAYTFDTFVVGPNNSLAQAAAKAVSEDPGNLYNPLFIYGNSGLGKTHLLHAIGNAIHVKNNNAVILYQTADRFVNEFIHAIRCNKFHTFQKKYQMLDVLLIDDIQFISNKEQTQEAFFHIFNILYDSRKQIVFSSDIFPREIKGFAERLRSRLEWGLVADIHTPPLETKIAILKKKAAVHGKLLDDDIAEYIALHAETNIRELEGSLVRVLAFSSLSRQPITLELVQKILVVNRDHLENFHVDFTKIATRVCQHYSYKLGDLRSNSRAKELSLVRQVAMYLMKKMTNKSLREIGTFLGRKDHSTVIYAFDKVKDALDKDIQFRTTIKKIEEDILR